MSHHEDGLCHKEIAPDAPPLFQNGNINFQAYHIGWIISGIFTFVSVVVSFWLINKHLTWYTNKKEQRYIVRLLILVPLYAVISLASFIFWNHAIALVLIRDSYEAIALTAFFYLLLNYISHDPEEQRAAFLKLGLSREADAKARLKGEKGRKWIWPMGFVKWKPKDGLYFLQLMKWGILQYCVLRPLMTIVSVILDYMGLYCETSWGFGWGHVYNVIIVSISVTIAMYCLIQLYVPVAGELAHHRPLLKLFAIKAVVFLTFWQATFLAVLSSMGVIKDSKYMTAEDINVGIGALLEVFEMMLFAFLHLRAFSYKPYKPENDSNDLPPIPTKRWRSLGHALDFRETAREIWVGCLYMFDKVKGKEPRVDVGPRRAVHYERAFGRERLLPDKPRTRGLSLDQSYREKPQPTLPPVEIEVYRELDIEGERQWMKFGRNSVLNPRRERSEALQDQIDHELEKRGYPSAPRRLAPQTSEVRYDPPQRHPSRSVPWWRSIYHRFSSSGNNPEDRAVDGSKWGIDISQEHWNQGYGHGHVQDRAAAGRRPSRYTSHPFASETYPGDEQLLRRDSPSSTSQQPKTTELRKPRAAMYADLRDGSRDLYVDGLPLPSSPLSPTPIDIAGASHESHLKAGLDPTPGPRTTEPRAKYERSELGNAEDASSGGASASRSHSLSQGIVVPDLRPKFLLDKPSTYPSANPALPTFQDKYSRVAVAKSRSTSQDVRGLSRPGRVVPLFHETQAVASSSKSLEGIPNPFQNFSDRSSSSGSVASHRREGASSTG